MENGDFIKIWYIGRLENGEIFDLTDEETAKESGIYNPKIKYKHVPIIIGAKFVIPGLETALLGMTLGEKKTIIIEPKDAFGNRDPKLVRVVPKSTFKDMEPKQGMVIDFSGIKGRIQSVSAGRVMVDFNNPLAGKKLSYEIEITERIDKPEQQVGAIFEFLGVENTEISISGDTVEVKNVKLPRELKERISSLIIEHVKSDAKIEKVCFIETYSK
ncbi:MAG: peptidylprolyl isomerase [Candidatus Aenigmatarchaeota archaeon]